MAEVRARAGLVGHPSDGFGGATVSVTIDNFSARVHARAAPELDVAPEGDGQWPEGGRPLVSAAIERFAQHCDSVGAEFDSSVHVRYRSTIPRQVGLGGSSAIVIATLRALATVADLRLDPADLVHLALAVETEGLGIAAGLQDRVVQAYGGLIFMDFDPEQATAEGHGRYQPLDPELLPPLFVAWRPDAGTPSGVAHADVRARFDSGERKVRDAMAGLARLAHEARAALLAADHASFTAALVAGYYARASIYDLDPRHVSMVAAARHVGLSATYTGSGGAIVGVVSDPEALPQLEDDLATDGVRVERALIRPR
jgi:glucuronokinase